MSVAINYQARFSMVLAKIIMFGVVAQTVSVFDDDQTAGHL